jgi:hypothetical protein
VAGDLTFLVLRAGPESTCGLLLNGDLHCWGGSEIGGEAIEPRLVQQGFEFTSMEYGGNFGGRGVVCAQTGAGNLYCFGYEPHELLPQPTPSAVVLPGARQTHRVAVGGVWTPDVDLPYAYETHSCVLDVTGAVSCWGTNAYGQLGDSTIVAHTTPANVPGLTGIARLTAGGIHSCAVTGNGVAYCWGANHRGQLGIGAASDSETSPREVAAP